MLSRVRIPSVRTVAQWVEYTTKWQGSKSLWFNSTQSYFYPKFRHGLRTLGEGHMQLGLQPENQGYRKQDGRTTACIKSIFLHGQSVSNIALTGCLGKDIWRQASLPLTAC